MIYLRIIIGFFKGVNLKQLFIGFITLFLISSIFYVFHLRDQNNKLKVEISKNKQEIEKINKTYEEKKEELQIVLELLNKNYKEKENIKKSYENKNKNLEVIINNEKDDCIDTDIPDNIINFLQSN